MPGASNQKKPVQRAASNDVAALQQSLTDHLIFSVGKDPLQASSRDWFLAAAFTVRDRLVGQWMETLRGYHQQDAKRVYYLSMEFLIGRALTNSLINLTKLRLSLSHSS